MASFSRCGWRSAPRCCCSPGWWRRTPAPLGWNHAVGHALSVVASGGSPCSETCPLFHCFVPTNRKLILLRTEAKTSNERTKTTNSASATLLNVSATHDHFPQQEQAHSFQVSRSVHTKHLDNSFCMRRAIRQTGTGPRPMRSGLQGRSELCVQGADSTSDHCHWIWFCVPLSLIACMIICMDLVFARFTPTHNTDSRRTPKRSPNRETEPKPGKGKNINKGKGEHHGKKGKKGFYEMEGHANQPR